MNNANKKRRWLPGATSLIVTICAASMLLVPDRARAQQASATCNVEIDYLINGALEESYVNGFVISRGETFVDDFSTPTREKRFTATMDRVDGRLVVSIDYFNDVGTFTAISLDTSLRIRGVNVVETTGGGHTFSSSQAVPAGNHTTNHTLTCFRNDPGLVTP